MTYREFRNDFEKESDKWSEKYEQMSELEILSLIENREWDLTYQIWHSIRKKGTIEKSTPVLMKVLRKRFTSFLNRNHCAEALFSITKINDEVLKKRVIGSLQRFRLSVDRKKALNELERRLKK